MSPYSALAIWKEPASTILVNRILITLIDGARDSSGIKQQGAKQALLTMLSKDFPKQTLLQLDCLREDILSDDLGL